MNNPAYKAKNAVDADLAIWNKRQQQYVQIFGNELMRDRDFLKAQYQVLQEIRQRHRKSNLSFDERISMRVLRGQIRQLNRRIYPNPVIRLLRNSAVLIYKLLTLPLKTGKNLAQVLTKKPTSHQPNYSLTSNQQALANEVVGQAKEVSISTSNQPKSRQPERQIGLASHHQEQILAKKTLNQNRVVMPDAPAMGMKV